MSDFIPVNTPLFDGNEEKYLVECIKSGWISSEGRFIQQFENTMATTVNRQYGVAVSNGSAALDIAIAALGLKSGDEVIMPTFTIISPAFSIVRQGAKPVLVDSDPNTWNIDVTKIEEKITKKTKAILIVHIYGLPVDMDKVIELCNKYNIFLIEDAAEMHGQTYKNIPCGSFGNLSIFSFYPNKHVTCGEGGMILTNDCDIADKCKKLRNLSFETQGRRFIHYEMGWNYRMTNMQAAIGLAQLEKLDVHIDKKRRMGRLYYENLYMINQLKHPLIETSYAKNIYWVYGLVTENQNICDSLISFLNRNGIGTRPFFWCMHEQPVFRSMGLFENEKFPVAENLSRCGFYLPSGLGLNDHEINKISQLMHDFYGKN